MIKQSQSSLIKTSLRRNTFYMQTDHICVIDRANKLIFLIDATAGLSKLKNEVKLFLASARFERKSEKNAAFILSTPNHAKILFNQFNSTFNLFISSCITFSIHSLLFNSFLFDSITSFSLSSNCSMLILF